jgi:DNA-binding SARP family transcriptional activator/tetratricopeptide (TPR) repeat protein
VTTKAHVDSGGKRDPKTVQLLLAGTAAVRRADGAVRPLAPLDSALLAFVAVEGPTARQRLLQLLWPGQEPESARNALRQRLFRLRRGLDADVVVQGGEMLALAPGVTHDLDNGEGELLAGLSYADCTEFDAWLDSQRAAIHLRRRQRQEARVDALEGDGQLAEGTALAERLVSADPLDEAAARRLMRLHYLQGERSAALAAYDRLVAALAKAHDARPSPRTCELMETIRAASAPQATVVRRDIPTSLLRPPRLVGRERERASLRDAWAGQRVFWLLGEAGLGKTRLIGEFAAEAASERAAAQVLVVSARPSDAGVPYASLGRALRAVLERRPATLDPAQRSELARVLPEIESHAAMAAALPGRRLTLHAALEALLRDAHAGGLDAIVIDDLHFADGASLEMLQGLLLADGVAALRWGFAQRPAEGDAAVEALSAALEEEHRVEYVALGPLDEGAMHELVDSLGLDRYDPAALAPLLVRHTGGNPLYALETIKHLIATGARSLDDGLPRPPSIRHLIERRLRQLSPSAIGLARIAAIAGVDFSIELAEQVLDTRALALTDPWRELEGAQVLRDFAFAHDLVLEATLAGIPAPIAAHAHGAIAAFLETRGNAPARVAAHWIASGQPQRARAALHAAADAARRAMRRKEEAAFLSRAAQIEKESGDDAVFETLRAMIEALWASDRGALDAASYDRLEAAASTPQQRGVALATRGVWAHEQGDVEEAKRLCRQAIDLADAAADEATGAQARQRLGQILHFCGDFDGAVALMQQLQPWMSEHASDAEKVDFYGDLAIVLDNADRGSEARTYHKLSLELGRKTGAWSDVVTVLGNLSISWATAGYMNRAIELLYEAMRLGAAHDEARGCGATLPIELHNALRDCGRYGDALDWLEPALAAADGQVAVWKPLVRCQVACSWIHLGQHARAQREIDAALAAEAPDWMRAKALQMRARMRVGMGRGAQALLGEAHALMALDGRRGLRASIMLDHALALAAPAALAAAREVIAESERLGLPGPALAGHIRAMRFAVDAGRADDAVLHARACAAIDADIMPSDLYPAEKWLNAWRAWQLAGEAQEARAALAKGAGWVRQTLRAHVPEPFRDSFVRANPVNEQLLRAAAQAGLDRQGAA